MNCGCYLYALYSRSDQFQIPYETLAAHRILFVKTAARNLKRKTWHAGHAVRMLGMLSVRYLDVPHGHAIRNVPWKSHVGHAITKLPGYGMIACCQ